MSGIVIRVKPVAFANAANHTVKVSFFGRIGSFKCIVFINDKLFIRVTDVGIVYVSSVFPGGYAYNIVPSFDNNTPSTEENEIFAGSTLIFVNSSKKLLF